jgi:hypothetical protein
MKIINEPNYNCFGYVLDKKKWVGIKKFMDIVDAPRNKADRLFLKRIKPLLKKAGFIYVSELPKEDDCVVARYGDYDFHFMKRVNGEWSHKRGMYKVENVKEEEVLSTPWLNPGNEYCPDEYYDSRIFIFKKMKLNRVSKILSSIFN